MTKTQSRKSKVTYYYYTATWRPIKREKQRSKSFTYASLNHETDEYTYDADLEFKAFRSAIHFRHLALLYKREKLEFNPKVYQRLNCWYAYSPEWLFHVENTDITTTVSISNPNVCNSQCLAG